MKIVQKKVAELVLYANNPRKNDPAVDAVVASIKEFGFKVPIVIDIKNEIIAGHTRLKAAKKLGMVSVPCIIADDLTDEQVKAFRLADNKVGEIATWDLGSLGEELDALADFDMERFGFEKKQDDILEEDPEIEFTEELLEEHNYVVLYFDNAVDWLQAETLFDLKPVKALDSKPGFQKIGVGRVLNGTEAIKKIIGDKK
jgi:site-specific DNA-methyltransferase (adenine-specific)